ncbi:hypothetical protein MCAMS1_01187 [biofilm metagenome]
MIIHLFMKIVYSNTELGYALVEMPFVEWLALPESKMFIFDYGDEHNHWLNLDNWQIFSALSAHVKLLRVNGALYKLDGKQRKAVWLTDKTKAPETITALVFDIPEASFLAINSEARNKQMEILSSGDAVKAVFDEQGLIFSSARLRDGLIVDAIHIALRGRQRTLQDKSTTNIDLYKAIHLFTPELKLLDSLTIRSEVFVTGVLAAALIFLASGKDITGFLTRLNDLNGQLRPDGYGDPIAGLLKAINAYRMSSRKNHASASIELCKNTVQAILYWEDGADSPKYWRKRDLTGVDHMPFVRELRILKQINESKDL